MTELKIDRRQLLRMGLWLPNYRGYFGGPFTAPGSYRTGGEKRSPEEISVFNHVARVAYDIIAEAFSNKVIVPDVTTTDDLNWWIRQRYWTSVPEWDGQDVRIVLEQNVAMTEHRLIFLGGRQVDWYVVK